jgi:hypothetical protein
MIVGNGDTDWLEGIAQTKQIANYTFNERNIFS